MTSKVLRLLKPFCSCLPSIHKPNNEVTTSEKFLWTGLSLFLYSVLCQIPIFGVISSETADPFYWMRTVLASRRGTLMELGIFPLATSYLITQFLAGTKIIRVFHLRKQIILFNSVQKFIGLVLTIGQATAYVMMGMYGNPKDLGRSICILIIAELSIAGLILLLIDEMLKKGYGLGSGLFLFSTSNVCETIIWKAWSICPIKIGKNIQFEGSLMAFIQVIMTSNDYSEDLNQLFFRENSPNLLNVGFTFLMFLAIIYMHGFCIYVKAKSIVYKNQLVYYPIHMFYTANMAVLLHTTLISNLYLISHILTNCFRKSTYNKVLAVAKFLGTWTYLKGSSPIASYPTEGVCYYISPPIDGTHVLKDPVQTIIYMAFTLCSYAFFSSICTEVSEMSTIELAKKFKDQNYVSDSGKPMINKLSNYMPIVSTFGGLCVGLFCILTDLFASIGFGSAILLAVTTIFQYSENLQIEENDILQIPIRI